MARKYKTSKIIPVQKLTIKNILKFVTEAEIYRYYLGFDYQVKKRFSSPFREDINPSFGIFPSSDHKLLFKDFATGESGNVFQFVQKCKNISFIEALRDIASSFNLPIIGAQSNGEILKFTKYNKVFKAKDNRLFTTLRAPTEKDFEFWSQGNISKSTLSFYNIMCSDTIYYNRKPIWVSSENNPIYSWAINNKLKAYRPFEENKRFKWLTNQSIDDIQGYFQLPKVDELLFITSSLKDVMTLYELGIPAVAPLAETVFVSEEKIMELKDRFKNIYVNFDNDIAGVNNSINFTKKYNLFYWNINKKYGAKDPFDFVKKYDSTLLLNHIKEKVNV